MFYFLQENIDPNTLENLGNWGNIIAYIVSVVIGGVGYKYFNLWLSHNEGKDERQLESNQKLIENLENRLSVLNKRTEDLEDKVDDAHNREIELTKMLAKAETKVEVLENKVKVLERNHSLLESTVNKYYKKYGPLEGAVNPEDLEDETS